MNDRIKKWLSQAKNAKILLGIGIAGMLLIALSSWLPEIGEKSTVSEEFDISSYREQLEESVASITRQITGCKDVQVFLTLDTGMRYYYADTLKSSQSDSAGEKDSDSQSQSEQNYIILTDASGNEKALLLHEELPAVRGVAVVVSGGASGVNDALTEALTASLGITSKRICIVSKGEN